MATCCISGHLLGRVRWIRIGVAVAKGQGPAAKTELEDRPRDGLHEGTLAKYAARRVPESTAQLGQICGFCGDLLATLGGAVAGLRPFARQDCADGGAARAGLDRSHGFVCPTLRVGGLCQPTFRTLGPRTGAADPTTDRLTSVAPLSSKPS